MSVFVYYLLSFTSARRAFVISMLADLLAFVPTPLPVLTDCYPPAPPPWIAGRSIRLCPRGGEQEREGEGGEALGRRVGGG